MNILDGKLLSSKIKDEVKAGADSYHQTPILAVITIGDDEASKIFVKNKRKALEYCGMSMMHFDYADVVKESVVIRKIKELNRDKTVNGIILQLPIPSNFNTRKILNTISPLKDVDGLTEISQGRLLTNEETFIPCTPKGILEFFDYYKIDLKSKHVVIIGKSELVGMPLMIECVKRDASVTICESNDKNLADYTKRADVLIVNANKKYLIDKTMIKKNVIIVDAGTNIVNGSFYGDVNPNVSDLVSYISLVPGGVGPMTVAMLLKNTLIAYKLQNDKE